MPLRDRMGSTRLHSGLAPAFDGAPEPVLAVAHRLIIARTAHGQSSGVPDAGHTTGSGSPRRPCGVLVSVGLDLVALMLVLDLWSLDGVEVGCVRLPP